MQKKKLKKRLLYICNYTGNNTKIFFKPNFVLEYLEKPYWDFFTIQDSSVRGKFK